MTIKTLSPNNTRRLSRETWAWLLIISNAVSMAMMYAMQGYLMSGESLDALPNWFWPADVAGWMVRSIVESLVVFYLFRTEARNAWDKALLTFFEVSLVVLIMATQGPALYAISIQAPIGETLTDNWHRLWATGLGTYGALMLAAAGVAYRIQPNDVETIELSTHNQVLADATAKHKAATALKESLHTDAMDAANKRTRKAQSQLADLQVRQDEFIQSLASQQSVVKETQSQLVHLQKKWDFIKSINWATADGVATAAAFVANGDGPTPKQIAGALSVTTAAVRPGVKKGRAMAAELDK